jgi:cell division protein FtsI (penicillin-binding protein 3)/stage V sporulation protein D (sporulation-specific penicillin-binding protein)
VAAALNTYQSGYTENGVRKGVEPNFTFLDYNQKGKPYTELDGTTYYIQNANGISYQRYGKLGIKEIIRDSINTGIADIVDKTGARKLKEYYEQQFKFGQQTAVALPGDSAGNISSFSKNLNCPLCYANFGFGQGFNISPIQLMRAYTAIANNGFLVEPYLVEKINYKDGTVDDGSSLNSLIPKQQQLQVITPTTSKLVTAYMQAMVEEGYLGLQKSLGAVPGYQVAGKSGTAEINRPYMKLDSQGKVVLDDKNQPVMVPCDYSCNRKRGHYDHTFVGFGPVKDPKYIVLVKLGEPNPGQVRNFSSDTVGKPFSQMMEFTLNYAGIAKDF